MNTVLAEVFMDPRIRSEGAGVWGVGQRPHPPLAPAADSG